MADRPSNVNAVIRNRPEIADTNLRLAKQYGIEVTPDEYLVLYHGTRSEKKIAHGGVLKIGTYMADRTTAAKFARAAQQAGRPTVMRLEVPPGSVMPSGGNESVYFSLNEPLQLVKGTGKANYIYQMNVAENIVDGLLHEADEDPDINDFMRDQGTFQPVAPFTADQVVYKLEMEPAVVYDIDGHFDDPAGVAWVKAQLAEGNQWAWCLTQVIATWTAPDGRAYEGKSGWLGSCSYRSEEDFKTPGGYYDDMKKEAYDALVGNVKHGETVGADEP